MWKRKIERKKLQFFLVGLILAVTSAIFAGCLIFAVESEKLTNDYFSRSNNADAYGFLEGEQAKETITKKAKADNKITEIKSVDVLNIKGIYEINGKKQSVFLVELFRTEDYTKFPFPMEIVKGKEQKHPGEGEIWVTKLYADSNDLKLGDELTFHNQTLKISGFVNCSFCPNSLMSLTAFYINDSTYQSLKDEYYYRPLVLVKSRDKDYALEFLTEGLKGKKNNIFFSFNLDALKSCVKSLTSVFGGIGILAAFVIFIVSILIIRYLIKTLLVREYKAIGIHKALGDSSKEISRIYMKAYLFVGAIGITIGSILGLPIAYKLGKPQLIYVREFHFSYLSVLMIAVTIVLLLCLLAINVKRSLKRVYTITPVETLRVGMNSSKKKLSKSLIKNASSSFAMAVNDLVKHKSNSILMIILMGISIFLSLVFVNLDYSCQKISDNRNQWFAFPKTDVTLTGNISDEMISELKQNDMVKNCITGSIRQGLSLDKGDKNCRFDFSNISSMVYENWDEEITQISLMEGRAPENIDEIIIGDKLMKENDYEVGDYISIKVNGTKHEFLITGRVNCMMNSGQIIGFQSDVYQLIPASEVKNDYLFINLKEGNSFSQFKKEINKTYDNVSVDTITPEIETSCQSVCDVASPISLVLVFVFVIFSIINIINLLAMDYINNRRQYGILKSLGFTNGYICRKSIFKTGTLLMFSMVAGIALYQLLGAKIFEIGSGIDAMVTSMPYTMGVLVLLGVVVFAVTLLFCLPIRKIEPTELMEE